MLGAISVISGEDGGLSFLGNLAIPKEGLEGLERLERLEGLDVPKGEGTAPKGGEEGLDDDPKEGEVGLFPLNEGEEGLLPIDTEGGLFALNEGEEGLLPTVEGDILSISGDRLSFSGEADTFAFSCCWLVPLWDSIGGRINLTMEGEGGGERGGGGGGTEDEEVDKRFLAEAPRTSKGKDVARRLMELVLKIGVEMRDGEGGSMGLISFSFSFSFSASLTSGSSTHTL